MELSVVLSLVTGLANDTSDFGRIQYARLLALLAEKESVAGTIDLLVAALKREAGFTFVDPNLTSANCPLVVEAQLEGQSLEKEIAGSRPVVLAELKKLGRRSATVIEGLFEAKMHPEKLESGSWIWCLGQILVFDGMNCVLVLAVFDGSRHAILMPASAEIPERDGVLTFPMTEAELAARDAADAEAAMQRND